MTPVIVFNSRRRWNCYSRLVEIYFLEILVDSGNTVFLFSMTTSDCRTKILFVSDLLCLYVLIFIDYLQFCRIC